MNTCREEHSYNNGRCHGSPPTVVRIRHIHHSSTRHTAGSQPTPPSNNSQGGRRPVTAPAAMISFRSPRPGWLIEYLPICMTCGTKQIACPSYATRPCRRWMTSPTARSPAPSPRPLRPAPPPPRGLAANVGAVMAAGCILRRVSGSGRQQGPRRSREDQPWATNPRTRLKVVCHGINHHCRASRPSASPRCCASAVADQQAASDAVMNVRSGRIPRRCGCSVTASFDPSFGAATQGLPAAFWLPATVVLRCGPGVACRVNVHESLLRVLGSRRCRAWWIP